MKIAIVSLLADAGHVIPLFKIADMLQQKSCNLVYIGPEETIDLAPVHLKSKSLGLVRPQSYKRCMQVISRQTPLKGYIFFNRWFCINYNEQAVYNGYQKLEALIAEVETFNPDLIIADDHNFTEAYEFLAYRLNKPLILNNSEGSFRKQVDAKLIATFRKNLKYYYYTTLKHCFEKSYVFAKSLITPKTMWQLFVNNQWLAAIKAEHQKTLANKLPNLHLVSPGISVMEELYLPKEIEGLDRVGIMGPLPLASHGHLEQDLVDWLNIADRVVFVCFGTMMREDPDLIQKVLWASKQLKLRVLWASPDQPVSYFFQTLPENFKWIKWGLQPEILRHKHLKLFVTHAGAGAVQEALWNAVPMVVIPHIWDQDYNGLRAAELGVAAYVDRQTITYETMLEAFEHALSYLGRAKELAEVFRSKECSNDFFALLQDCIA